MNVMVDLETMGHTPGAAILSIGAVIFEPRGSAIDPEQEFYCNVDLASCLRAGLRIDAPTVEWWLKRDDAARLALFEPRPILLDDALGKFSEFVAEPVILWAHGATFDPVLLDAAYRAAKRIVPWKYWNVRDTRTIYDAAKFSLPKDVHHQALDDARTQARGVQECYSRLSL